MSDGLRVEKGALAGIPKQDVQRILNKIDWIWANRRDITHESLKENLSGFFKRRLGQYRIIYTYDENPDDGSPDQLVVRLVATRAAIYREASKRLD